MARIRSIKPDIRRSLTVSSWPYVVRWTFAGLPGYCDDHGRGLDDIRLVKAELYPLDDDMTARKLDRHLDMIANTGSRPPLCRYEVAGQRYFHLVNWSEHQRPSHPTPSRIPPCPLHEASGNAPEVVPNDSREVRERFVPSRTPAEQGAGKGAGSRGPNAGGGQPAPPVNGQRPPPPLDATAELFDATGPWLPDVQRSLKPKVTAALKTGADPAHCRAALVAWRSRPGAGPGLFQHLVRDAAASDHDGEWDDGSGQVWV